MDNLEWDITSSVPAVKPNEPFEVHVTVRNGGPDTVTALLHLSPPLAAEPNHPVVISAELAAGDDRTFSYTYRLTEGGKAMFWAWIGSDPHPDKRRKCCVFSDAPGYYSGDTHTHSVYSDGKSTLAQNRNSMMDKGHSFLISTDHNTLEHAPEVARLSEQDRMQHFCHLAGWEYTTAHGHALAFGFDEWYDPQRITALNDLAGWQAFVDTATANGGVVYFAHPYEAPRFEYGDDVIYGIRGITGIEVWNGYQHHAMDEPNRRSFDAWDNRNSRGDRRYYGNCVSDGHIEAKPGDPYIKGWMERPTREEVFRLLKTGAFIGSNGPDVRFRLGDAGIGGVCRLKTGEHKATCWIQAFDPFGRLEHIVLYRNRLHPKGLPQHQREVVFEVNDFCGTERRLFDISFSLPVAPGEFYRVEVRSRYGTHCVGGKGEWQGKGFAYTNPIWVE